MQGTGPLNKFDFSSRISTAAALCRPSPYNPDGTLLPSIPTPAMVAASYQSRASMSFNAHSASLETRVLIPLHLLRIKVGSGHPAVRDRLLIAAHFIKSHLGVCIFHLLICLEPAFPHETFHDCEYAFGTESPYQQWRKQIRFIGRICYPCACPYKEPEFGHEEGIGSSCSRTSYQELMKPLAYIVYFAPALKAAVFQYLGLAAEPFVSAEEYAIWLGATSGSLSSMSNLLEIVYAVAALQFSNELPDTNHFIVSLPSILHHSAFLTCRSLSRVFFPSTSHTNI